MVFTKRTLEESMKASVSRYVVTDTGCWEFQGARSKEGYGKVSVRRKHYGAHRLSFFVHNGFWPEPCCLHSCDNPPCINPDHLSAGDNAENMRQSYMRGQRKGLAPSSPAPETLEPNLHSIQTIIAIKRLLRLGHESKQISRSLRMPLYIVQDIKHGRMWNNVQA